MASYNSSFLNVCGIRQTKVRGVCVCETAEVVDLSKKPLFFVCWVSHSLEAVCSLASASVFQKNLENKCCIYILYCTL